MGAVADHIGNITSIAEFNMWADPHAVDVVPASDLDVGSDDLMMEDVTLQVELLTREA